MASFARLPRSLLPPEDGVVLIVNETGDTRRCCFYPADEERCGEPIFEVSVTPYFEGKIHGCPAEMWMRLFDPATNTVLQRSFVLPGQRIDVISSPYSGFRIDPCALGRGPAVAEARGDGRDIRLGCEYLGPVPGDYEGAFHWGLVLGTGPEAFAYEVTGQGASETFMTVVGPRGRIACNPEHPDPPSRRGRTLEQFGPGPIMDGLFTGGHILLPMRTTKKDAEIEEWVVQWVRQHPWYGRKDWAEGGGRAADGTKIIGCNCQHFCADLYHFLVDEQDRFPYRPGNLELATVFTKAHQLPHYQCTFQWTCRQEVPPSLVAQESDPA